MGYTGWYTGGTRGSFTGMVHGARGTQGCHTRGYKTEYHGGKGLGRCHGDLQPLHGPLKKHPLAVLLGKNNFERDHKNMFKWIVVLLPAAVHLRGAAQRCAARHGAALRGGSVERKAVWEGPFMRSFH